MRFWRVLASFLATHFLFSGLFLARAHADDSCEKELAPKLSSQMYVYIDSRGKNIDPYTAKLLQDVKPGGVLLSRNTKTLEDISQFTSSAKEVYSKSGSPVPFIGADYVDVAEDGWPQDLLNKKTSEMGFGTRINGFNSKAITGLATQVREMCLKTIGSIKAFTHKIVGINHPLGPQVEAQINAKDFKKMSKGEGVNTVADIQGQGVVPTIKHYPFTLEGMNLHDQTLSPELSEKKLKEIEKTFFGSADGRYVVMTTHVGTKDIDSGNLATFSPAWVERLRNQIGNENLIMTDGLFMIGSYPEYLSKASGISKSELSSYFKGSEYGDHGSPVFPWRYAYDPTFIAVRGVLKKYKDYDFRGQSESLANPQNGSEHKYAKESQVYPELQNELAQALSKKYGYQFKEVKDPSIGIMYLSSDNPAGNAALAKAMKYSLMLNKNFNPEKAHEIGAKVVAGFAEKAILSGHDLFILEGGPIKETYQELLSKACHENPKLKEKIEQASDRISKFKLLEKEKIETRSNPEWLKSHKKDIEHLIYDIYPAILDSKDPCRMDKLNEAKALLRCLN